MQDPGFPVQGGHQRLRRLPPGRGEEFYIPWECIQRIGDDIILIDKPFQRRDPRLERKRRKRC